MRAWFRSVVAASLALGGLAPTASGAVDPPAARTLPILVYHEFRVSGANPPDGTTAISLQHFESQMRELKARGYTTLNMGEVIRFLKGERFPEKVIAIHLDDGWESGLSAIPILDELGFKATFWIISGTGIGWPHVNWSEVETIASNPQFELFSHTLTHPWKDNDTLPDWLGGRTPGKGEQQVRRELTESRRILEEKLRRPVPYLAWPSGRYNDALITLARQAGYTALLTIDSGMNLPHGDVLRIHRTMIDGRCNDQTFDQILTDGKMRECPN